jgi:(E)-4-hydroxy-3-methylbut-2-enyl-diphosphate synthase
LVDCARECRIPIRIGVNAGSLEKDILEAHQGVSPLPAWCKAPCAMWPCCSDQDFHDIKISIKASDVPRTLEAYRLLSQKTDLPLHVGVTEAGSLYSGIVKSALGIGTLLAEGIGDTLRVSLTRDPLEEIRVGYEILRALDIRHRGPEIISCPTCGRCDIPLFDIVDRVEKRPDDAHHPGKTGHHGMCGQRPRRSPGSGHRCGRRRRGGHLVQKRESG